MFKHNLTAKLNTQRPDQFGQYPLRIRATIKRNVTYYQTGIMLKKDQWFVGEKINEMGKKIKLIGEVVKHQNKALLNIQIRAKIAAIEKQLLENSITGESFKISQKTVNLKFSDYAKKKIQSCVGSMAPGTIKQKNVYLNKFNEFRPGIRIKDVGKNILADFETFCREKKGNNGNSVWGNSKFVKSILNAAVDDGLFPVSPLKKFKGTKYKDPLRIVLTADEIEKIENFADNEKNLKKLRDVAGWFLFSVFSGLRYGDLASFKGFLNDKVMLATEKTGDIVSIFATKKIIKARTRLTGTPISNQKMNDHLKLIALACNIDKRVTVHLARHTFAVEYLNRKGDIFILSKILGHASLKTTEIYAKLSNPRADEDMRKVWDTTEPEKKVKKSGKKYGINH